MSTRRFASILITLVFLAAAATACNLPFINSEPSAETVASLTVASLTAMAADSGTEGLPTPTPEIIEPSDIPEAAPLSVAFVAPDGNAYYWNEYLNTPNQLTTTGDVRAAYVSPDGTLVALARSADESTYTLDVVNSDGTGLRTLVSPEAFAAFPRPVDALSSIPNQVEWLPDTHTIIMNTRITFEGPGSATGENLYLIDADDGSITAPISIPDAWFFRFTISPDGSKIAISLPEGIEIYNLDGSKLERKVLAYEFVNTASEYAWVASPVWSADSQTLAAVVPPKEPFSDVVADSTVWLVSADGLSGEMTFSRKMTYTPDGFAFISPDLRKILYLTQLDPSSSGKYALNLSNLDGSDSYEYAVGSFFAGPVTWSTDSTKFYYYDNDTGAYMGQPGQAPQSLPDFSGVKTVEWIDGSRFIGASGPEGGWKLLLGTVGSATGVIYSTPASGGSIIFTINR